MSPRRPLRLALLLLVTLGTVPVLSAPAHAQSGLLFSEYVEGTGTNRAVEVYNGTGAAVNLANYNVRVVTEFGFVHTINLSGTLAAGDVVVLAYSFASQDLKDRADLLSDRLVFTGDDAVLLRGHDGLLVDAIGRVGEDPGPGWGSGETSTVNATLRRKSGVTTGDTDQSDPFDPAVEWDGYPVDTFDGLGWHSRCETVPPALFVSASPDVLWPPNHKMVPVEVSVFAVDDTDPAPAVELVSVTSNEPAEELGGGGNRSSGDMLAVDLDTVELRATRSPHGVGRVYTLTYRATDACGNSTEAAATVQVPLNSAG